MRYPSDIFFLSGGAKSMRKRFQCEKDFSIRIGPTGIFSIQNHRNSLGIHWNLLEIMWNFGNLTKFNATPDLLDSINQWRAENLFHHTLFLIGPDKSINGQNRNQWNLFQQKSFFISAGRINQSMPNYFGQAGICA